jgi:DNA ligase-1
MLHRDDALYRAERTDDLLKLKPHEDAEAQVLEHLPGTGKYAGILGSLLVETEDGVRFRIGTGLSDEQRRNPPPIGSVITFKYHGKTRRGIPRFASFLRVRENY